MQRKALGDSFSLCLNSKDQTLNSLAAP